MKTQSVAMAAHRATGSTTLARCWKVTRTDGEVFGFTSIDRTIVFDGVTYRGATGFTPSAVASQADLSVPNMEVAGVLDSSAITEADLLAGLWDNAQVEVFEVNFLDLTQGRMVLRVGRIGNVSAGGLGFRAELRGIAQRLQKPIGRVFSPGCSVAFGSAQCGYDVEGTRTAFTVTVVDGNLVFRAPALAGGPTEAFKAGEVTWVTGDNAGQRIEIVDFDTLTGDVTLALPLPYAIQVGDTGTAIWGCQKRLVEDCNLRFGNAVNFRGFPHLPGNAKVLGNAGLEQSDA